MASDKVYQISQEQRSLLKDRLLASIESEDKDWFKSWINPEPPQNFESGRWYTGCNRGLLSFLQLYYGYPDPRWIPAWRLKIVAEQYGGGWDWKGQKCCYVELWKEGKKKILDENDEPVLDDDGKPMFRTYMYLASVIPVLNMSQVKGAPEYEPKLAVNQGGDYAVADSIIGDYLPNQVITYIESAATGTAAWSPTKYRIYMPSRKLFTSAEAFTSTLMHETVHSTGPHFKRDQTGIFGTDSYAREELVAEFGSVFLAQNFGIEYTGAEFDNHVAYLQHWKQRVREKDGADFLMKAITDAENAARFVFEQTSKFAKTKEE